MKGAHNKPLLLTALVVASVFVGDQRIGCPDTLAVVLRHQRIVGGVVEGMWRGEET